MKKLIWLLLFLPLAAFGQGTRYENHPSMKSRADGALVAASATIAVCTQPANTGVTPCSPLATLFTDATLATPCTGTAKDGSQAGATNCSNPLVTDAKGNYHFYAAGSIYTIQVSGSGIATSFEPDIVIAGSIAPSLAATMGSATIAGSVISASTTLANNGAMGFSTLTGAFNPLSFGADPRFITAADTAFNTTLIGGGSGGMGTGGGGIEISSDNAFKFTSGLNLGLKNIHVHGEGASSIFGCTGITCVTMPGVSVMQSLRYLKIGDFTGNAATIGLDVESSPAGSGVTGFNVDHIWIEGTNKTAGEIGLKCHFCLIGTFENSLIQDWDIGVQIEGNGASHSNSNNWSRMHVRGNNTGVKYVANAKDDDSWFGPINEGNTTVGWSIAGGNGVTNIFGGHHENTSATVANMNVLGASAVAIFGGNFQSPAGKGIVLDATNSANSVIYSPDFFNVVNPVTNNGTGFLIIHDPYNMGTPNGTGKTYVWDRGNLTCTNCAATDQFNWSMGHGAKCFDVGSAGDTYINRDATNTIAFTTTCGGFTYITQDLAKSRYLESAAPAGASGSTFVWADSTTHKLTANVANAGAFQVAQVITATSAAFATATTAATCVQNTTTVTGATTAMAVIVSPVSTPGVGAQWSAFVSSAGNVTINECAVAASAGGTIAFNIRVIP